MAKAFVSGIGWAELQSKAVDIIDNGSIDILPDKATVFNKVTINTNVPHYDDGFVDGKQAEYDAFWDQVQDNGNRTNYNRGFCGKTWTDANFKPKYDIRPIGFSTMYNCFSFSAITDLAALLERQGVVLDTSKATGDFSAVFANSSITRIPTIDISGASVVTSLCSYCYNLKTIDKVIVGENTPYSYLFNDCSALENITFAGSIAQNGLNLQWSTKLSRASIESIINALSDTTSGLSITLSIAAVDRAFAYAENGDDGSINQPWLDLVASKPNWAINLV